MADMTRRDWRARLHWQLRHALIRFKRLPPRELVLALRRPGSLTTSATVNLTAVPKRSERIVVSLTTIPERADALRPVLLSLLDQTCPADRIVLAWPRASLRTGQPYPAPPDLPGGIDLLPCDDEGPATKLLPAWRAERDALIVVVDDDVVYPRNFLADLLSAHRRDPTAALGLRGWRLRPAGDPRDFKHVFCTAVRAPKRVDILLGTWGYLLPPGALDDAIADFSGWPPELRWVDDVWISGHLARRGIARKVIPSRGMPIETSASRLASLTGGLNRSGRNDAIGIAAFDRYWTRPPGEGADQAAA